MKLVRYIESAALPISGRYYMQWDGRDDIGKYVSSGIYIYSIEVDGERRQGKLVVVRK
jgi:flagellar hook assembly protein FlgD